MVAEHASSHRIECGGWASLPAESARSSPRYVLPGHVAGPDPPAEGYLLRDMWRLRTYPKRGTGPEPLARCGKSLTRGAWLLRPLRVVMDNYVGPALL